MAWVSAVGQVLRQVARTRRLTQSHSSVLVADLAATTSAQGRLEVAYQAACLLLQQFGIEEPPQIRADGALIAPEWGQEYYRTVRRWAQDHDVACEVMRGHEGDSALEFTR